MLVLPPLYLRFGTVQPPCARQQPVKDGRAPTAFDASSHNSPDRQLAHR
jgi:hypothetical protein